MEAVAVLYIVVAAQAHGWHYLFFPGLAALSHDVLTRPMGKWAAQPGRLVITPVAGAAIGTVVTRTLPYGVLAILLVVTPCVLLLAALKSNIAPAIAAGVLPLFLGVKSWLYPVSVAVSLLVLVAILLPWQKYCRRKYFDHRVAPADTDDVLESLPNATTWVLPFFAFVTVMAWCASASGLRLILFPPLIVIAYEMFAHPATCPWARRPVALPAACVLTSGAGLVAANLLGSAALAAGCAMVFGIITLRLLHLHMPPALALGLLPLVIHAPNIKYPISVAIGTTVLTLTFLLYRRWVTGQGRAGRRVPKMMRSA
ncbi:hypothetical protein U8D42_03395 [Mycobacterium europaeum]|uniref:hypothetical protein n=1 Tax=Mycobacterium europaeum TaxID=761804 RepID=UPI002AE06F84|nr:hypothetical protein [Mycobacterium europaeum]MEA1159397.1 hypothetical protein [Mycobacterium europaeum]